MEFVIPESIDGLSLDDLRKLEQDATAAFDLLKNEDEPKIDELKKIAAFVGQVRTAVAGLTPPAEPVPSVADLDALVHPAAEPVLEGEIVDPAPAPQAPVLAGAGRRQAASPARRTPPAAPEDDGIVVTAAAGLRSLAAGARIADVDMLADAFDERVRAFPMQTGRQMVQTRIQSAVATFQRPESQMGPVVADGMSAEAFFRKIDEIVADQQQNLVASGGWCAPNLQVWDLCPGLETTDGIASWPSFQLQRGGIQYPNNLDFATIYSDANLGFHQVEADSIAQTPKTCYTIPCPTFGTARLEIDGICFKQDIVQNSVWPELTRTVMSRAMTAHEHKINARLIAQAATISASASSTYSLPLNGGDMDGDLTATGVLGGIQIAAVDYRYRLRLNQVSSLAPLECLVPAWLKEWLKSDIRRRAGDMAYLQVSDAQIAALFAQIGVIPQWVVDWQDGYVGSTALFGGSTSLASNASWPATVQVLLYTPGTWTKGGNGIIDLSAVYDSASLVQNNYTAAFTEESTLLLRRCYPSYSLTIPLCPTGQTSSLGQFDCSAN